MFQTNSIKSIINIETAKNIKIVFVSFLDMPTDKYTHIATIKKHIAKEIMCDILNKPVAL